MKAFHTTVSFGLIIGLFASAHASCLYSRVSTGVQQCKEETAAELKEVARPEMELPELPSTDEGKLMHVRCSCEYTYYGSNPLCDSSKTEEFDSAMGSDGTADPCAGARIFCNHLCPQSLD